MRGMTDEAKAAAPGSRWGQVKEHLAVTADVATVLTVGIASLGGMAALGALLFGVLTPMVTVWLLLVALVASLIGNGYLIRRVRRLTRANKQAWHIGNTWADMLQRNLQHDIEMSKQRQPEPSAWLPDPKNLDSLRLTTADLDRMYAKADATARDEIAPDAYVEFQSIVLLPMQCAYFEAYSTSSEVAGVVFVTPDRAWTGRLKRQRGTTVRNALRPWHIDTAWRELVRMSWLRERHMGEGVHLYWGNAISEIPSMPSGGSVHESGWLICYGRKSGGITEEPHCFTIRDGGLYPKP